MKAYHLSITSPDGDLFCGDAVFLALRAAEGDLAVMADHVPFVTAVKPCNCKVILPDESEKHGRTQGGLLTVGPQGVTLLSSSFSWEETEK